ncbi:MAG: iron-containing alcohol dehydrogenase [Bacteroidia bacterium]|nr:iron-containing alcohol dehydrogenase [Bacteroidia bacterium]
MENFTVYNPTKVVFGKNVITQLSRTVLKFGKNVLLVYGMGSIKANGIYKEVIAQLHKAGVKVVEYSGIKPNPVVDDVKLATDLGIEKGIDVIVAVGGGSVIDSAKIISLCIPGNLDGWDVMKVNVKPVSAIPLITVLTLAATGTEMNCYAVLQNNKTREKTGFGNDLAFPKYSFLDPRYTFTVPAEQTAYGVVDMIAHALEGFFGYGECTLTDHFTGSIIKQAMHYGRLALKEPCNYNYRANLMWAATCALNGMTSYGRTSADWGPHDIGHILSFLYDTPHGASLSIAYPAWLKLQRTRIPHRIKDLGKLLFSTNSINQTIGKFEEYFSQINCPVRLSEIGIGSDKKNEILSLMIRNKVNGFVHKLNKADYEKILNLMK